MSTISNSVILHAGLLCHQTTATIITGEKTDQQLFKGNVGNTLFILPVEVIFYHFFSFSISGLLADLFSQEEEPCGSIVYLKKMFLLSSL